MALTDLSTYINPPQERGSTLPFDGVIEFSRNERGREVVSLFVFPTPNDVTVIGEEITVRFMKARRNRDEEVVQARQVYTFAAVPPQEGIEFSLDLRKVVYSIADPFPLMRRGDYYITVEHSGGPTYPSGVETKTDDFRITLLTVDRLEREWLFGATRRSNDDRQMRFQPKQITGVRIVEISRSHPLDVYPLTWAQGRETAGGCAQDNMYLSWNKGEVVKVDMRVPEGIHEQYILMDEFRTGYVVAQVDPRYVPDTSVTERLMVDRDLISRESIRRWVDEETDWLEDGFLYTPIEPALCVSDVTLRDLSPSAGSRVRPLPENYDYDKKGVAIMYKPPTAGHWIDVMIPFGMPLKWEYLVGSLEHTRIVDVNTDWIQQAHGRMVQLVPFNQSLAYHFIGLMYVAALRGPVELPSFWRYRYWAGVRDETTPLDLIEVIGMRAGIKALNVLGQAFRGGFSSQSISKDGVSESVGYTASAMYGIYSATIEGLQKRLDKLEPQLKRRYFGVYLVTL